MKIPKSLVERDLFYKKVKEQCLSTQQERLKVATSLRNAYLFGDQGGVPARFNKLHPHLELVTSYLYSQDTTQFSVVYGENVTPLDEDTIESLNKFVNNRWLDTNADAVVGEAVLWSLVYNTMLVKLVWINDQLHVYPLPPYMFGVYREDVMHMDDQEAVVHVTYITKSELERRLAEHPEKDRIIDSVAIVGRSEDVAEAPSPIRQIIVASLAPFGATMTGNVNVPQSQLNEYVPFPNEDTVEINEMWIWDDDQDEYRVVTYAEPGLYLYDRPGSTFFLKGEVPFVKFSPIPLYNYFWGESELQHLLPLQELREKRMEQLAHLFELQARPPIAAIGMMGVVEEKVRTLRDPGGTFVDSSVGGQGKLDVLKPQLPEDPFAEVKMIDDMFSEVSGITPILQGRGESGVRSKGQTSALANMASARPKRRALIVEDSLEKLATLLLKVYKRESSIVLTDEKGRDFAVAQVSDDVVVKVSAHTSSPIFVEDQRNIAFELFKVRAIDRKTLIQLVHPAMEETILHRLKAIQQADAQKAQEDRQMQMAELQAGKVPKKTG